MSFFGLRCEGGRSKTLSPQPPDARSPARNHTLHSKSQHEKLAGIAISVTSKFAVDFAGIFDDPGVRNEYINRSSLSGGRFHRGVGGGESVRDLQGQPQEEQAEEERHARSATGEDPGPWDLNVGAVSGPVNFTSVELTKAGQG